MKKLIQKFKEFDYKEFMKKVSKEKNRYGFYFIIFLIGLELLFSIGFGINTYFNIRAMDEKLVTLEDSSTYSLPVNGVVDTNGNIYSVFDGYDSLIKDKNTLQDRFDGFQSPYSNFMRNLYLPSLNIWENAYTTGVDINLIGQYFLDKNPYLDINLLSKWGNFFKNSSDGVFANNILSINIGDIQEQKDGKFFIKVDVNFSSPTRRSFLMLIDKLSATSNKKNIGLINELMFNVFEQVKLSNKEALSATGIKNVDSYLGQRFYSWVREDKTNELLSEDIILKAIQKDAKCDVKADVNECMFKFRDKYSTIPSIAYVLGDPKNSNKVGSLKKFLKDMPPLLNISNFTFKKQADSVNIGNYEYVGQISIDVYGRSLADKELNDITEALGESCLKSTEKKDKKQYVLSIENISSHIKNKMNILSQNKDSIDTNVLKDMNDIQDLIASYQKDYPTMTNYKKAIKMFEMYRMLKENNLCN